MKKPLNRTRPKPDTISRAEFLSLRCGDLVIWDSGKRGFMFRTVQAGPADDPDRLEQPNRTYWHHVSFTKARGSQYPSTVTGYSYTDIRRKIRYTGKRYTKFTATPEELERLLGQPGKLMDRIKFDMNRSKCRKMTTIQKDPRWKRRVADTVAVLRQFA